MISGPVGIRIYEYEGRKYILIADRHNSVAGQCVRCDDIGDEYREGVCKTIQLYLHDKLIEARENNKYLDFYLESPFVLIDSVPNVCPNKNLNQNLDMIDMLQITFRKSLMRDKNPSPYMPCGRVHYCDIRDTYSRKYGENGLRESDSGNPLSGSWMTRRLNEEYGRLRLPISDEFRRNFNLAVEECTSLIQFILDNARDIFMSYMTPDFNVPVCPYRYGKNFNGRVERMRKVTSIYNGVRMHRVCKQLNKLDKETADKIYNWAVEKFENELRIARDLFEEWKDNMKRLEALDYDTSFYEQIRNQPVMISVVLGSLAMDSYFLARSMYHDESDEVIIFCGAAHVDNYSEFFDQNGGRFIEEYEGSDGQQRCINLRSTTFR